MIEYEIISTGSKGNATVIEKKVLIDCGVPYKDVAPYMKDLRLVLLTHIHGDHFKRSTIRRIAAERPTLRFGCCDWLVQPLVACGVDKHNIDVFEPDTTYGYGICNVIPFYLKHNVPNCGYKLHFGAKGKMIYATDTNNLYGISAADYDLYMIEANYEEAEIEEKIEQKRLDGRFAYEMQVKKNHLSKEKADDWLYRNMGPHSVYIYMHVHEDREEKQGAAS